jgi:hypothetical protein
LTSITCFALAGVLAAPVTAEVIVTKAIALSAPSPGYEYYDSQSIRLAWNEPGFMENDVVQLATVPDDAGFAAARLFPLTGSHVDDRHVTLAAAAVGVGTWYWRTCAEDGNPDGSTEYCSKTRSFSIAPAPEGFDPDSVDFCHDGLNNDEDFQVDAKDPGCNDSTPLTEVTTSNPKMFAKTARMTARSALALEFPESYEAGYAKRLRCNRTAKQKFACRASWIVGDSGFTGRVKVRYIWRRGGAEYVGVRYSMRVFHLNEYCATTGGKNCGKTYVRKGWS